MADPTEDLFDGLDRPRALPGPLRDRLEQQLLSTAGAPETVPLGAELDERLRTTLTDPLAAALADLDGPRPLSPELRRSLSRQLVRPRQNAQRVLGAAAAVVLVAALAVVLGQSGRSPHRTGPSSAAVPSSSPLLGAGTAGGVAGVTGDSAGAGGGSAAGSALATRGQVPSPAAPGSESSGQGGTAAASTARSGAPAASPDAGPVAGGTTVTLTGQGLSTATQVYFGRRAVSSYDVVSDSTIRAVTPPASGPGTVDVVVALRSGASYRLTSAFSYLLPPTVGSLSPTTGSTSGGTWVTVSGTALSRATSVSFGGTEATRVEVLSDSRLRALSPRHLAGPVDVTVTTPGGTSATGSGDRYTYLP